MKGDERRTPPTAMPVILTARTPGPVVVIVDPAAVVIRGPTPGLITNPGPAIRRNPDPVSVAIRRPVVIVVDNRNVWPPDPAIVIGVGPVAISVKVFGAPDVVVVILRVV